MSFTLNIQAIANSSIEVQDLYSRQLLIKDPSKLTLPKLLMKASRLFDNTEVSELYFLTSRVKVYAVNHLRDSDTLFFLKVIFTYK